MHYQYYNSNALLVINKKGKIRILYTPVRVKCIDNRCGLKLGVIVYVDEILFNEKDELIYMIGNLTYFHRHFKIEMLF